MIGSREAKGEEIAKVEGSIRRIEAGRFEVHSQTRDDWYEVVSTEAGWACSCPDYSFRGGKCKHVFGVIFSQAFREKVRESVVIRPITVQGCPKCESVSVKRAGIRHNRHGDIQKFRCKACGYWFTVNLGFEGMRATPEAITQAMQLYFTGESLRNVQKFLRLQGVSISHVSVYKWIRKYVHLMDGYLDQIRPQVSDTWRADELYVKVKGDMKYLFAIMDDETRFWIAQQITDTKYTSDVRPLFVEGRRVAGKRPKTMITDGGHHFLEPIKQEFYTLKYPRTKHIRDIRFDGSVHNNKMERLNGEVRDREKTFRGLKRTDTPILKGYRIFHNFVRPHESLKGETPADKAGIKVEGTNKWLTLIQNASQMTGVNREKNEDEKPSS